MRKVLTEKDLDYCLVPTQNEVLVFVDRVLYAKRKTEAEAKKVIDRIFQNRKRYCY